MCGFFRVIRLKHFWRKTYANTTRELTLCARREQIFWFINNIYRVVRPHVPDSNKTYIIFATFLRMQLTKKLVIALFQSEMFDKWQRKLFFIQHFIITSILCMKLLVGNTYLLNLLFVDFLFSGQHVSKMWNSTTCCLVY